MPHQCTNCGHVFEDGSKEMLSGCPDCGGNKFQYHPGDVPEESTPDAEPPELETGSVASAVGRAANKVRDAVSGDPATPAGRTGNDEQSSASESDAASEQPATASSAESERSPERSPEPDPEPRSEPETAPSSTSTAESRDAGESAPETGASASDESADRAPSQNSGEETERSGSPASADSASTEPGAGDTAASPGDTGVSDATETGDDVGTDAEDAAQADARSEVVDKDSLPDAPSDGRVVKEPDDPEDSPDLEDLRAELNDQFESIRIVAPGQYELNLMELYDRQEYIIALQEDGQYVIEVPDAWDADTE